MSPLQLSVYWRLCLVFFFIPFLFFLDIFTTAIIAATCLHHGNITGTDVHGTLPQNAESNQSQPEGGEADWRTESGNRDVSKDYLHKFLYDILGIFGHFSIVYTL